MIDMYDWELEYFYKEAMKFFDSQEKEADKLKGKVPRMRATRKR